MLYLRVYGKNTLYIQGLKRTILQPNDQQPMTKTTHQGPYTTSHRIVL